MLIVTTLTHCAMSKRIGRIFSRSLVNSYTHRTTRRVEKQARHVPFECITLWLRIWYVLVVVVVVVLVPIFFQTETRTVTSLINIIANLHEFIIRMYLREFITYFTLRVLITKWLYFTYLTVHVLATQLDVFIEKHTTSNSDESEKTSEDDDSGAGSESSKFYEWNISVRCATLCFTYLWILNTEYWMVNDLRLSIIDYSSLMMYIVRVRE